MSNPHYIIGQLFSLIENCGIDNLIKIVLLDDMKVVICINFDNSKKEINGIELLLSNLDKFKEYHPNIQDISICRSVGYSGNSIEFDKNSIDDVKWDHGLLLNKREVVHIYNDASLSNQELEFYINNNLIKSIPYRFYSTSERYLGFGDNESQLNCYWMDRHPKGRWTLFKKGESVTLEKLVEICDEFDSITSSRY